MIAVVLAIAVTVGPLLTVVLHQRHRRARWRRHTDQAIAVATEVTR